MELEARGQLMPGLDLTAHFNYIHLDPQLEAIPKQQGAAWTKYGFALMGVPGFSVGAGVRHMSDFKDGAAPTTPSSTLIDALLAWERAQ